MQALRDAATLVALILLALTVRIHLHGAPVEPTLVTPAEAGSTAEPLAPAEPAALPEVQAAATTPETELCPDLLELHPGMARPFAPRTFVWQVDGHRMAIVLAHPTPPPAPCRHGLGSDHAC